MHMNTKKWIFWAIVAAAVAALFIFTNFAPNFTCGMVLGWVGKIVYDKYIKNKA